MPTQRNEGAGASAQQGSDSSRRCRLARPIDFYRHFGGSRGDHNLINDSAKGEASAWVSAKQLPGMIAGRHDFVRLLRLGDDPENLFQ